MSRISAPVDRLDNQESPSFGTASFLSEPMQDQPRGKRVCDRVSIAKALRLAPRRIRNWMLALAALLLTAAGTQAQTSFSSHAVGSSTTVDVPVTITTAGTVSSVEVLTAGSTVDSTGAALDFQVGSGTLTCTGAVTTSGCIESVTFTPKYPGLRQGAVVVKDGTTVLGTALIYGTGQGGLGVFVNGTMLTVAGSDQWTLPKDGYAATAAGLELPSGVALDGAGNIYIADSIHNRIRKVTKSTGIISTIAGDGNSAYSGDGSSATSASLNTPSGITIDGAGDLYIADTGNNAIRKIAAATGMISTVAGSGPTSGGYSGDGSAATLAKLNGPWSVTLDSVGNMYIADTANHRIRMVDSSGNISTVAGNGVTNADGTGGYSADGGLAVNSKLNYPHAIAFDASGNMYIADFGNNRIRKVSAPIASGVITTYAGTGTAGYSGDAGLATSAALYSPAGVAIDPAGNLYIADTQNERIRKVNSATGYISTIAGNGNGGYSGDNGSALSATMLGPYGIFLDSMGNLFISDYFDNRIREVQGNLAILNYTASIRQGDQSATITRDIENDGNDTLDLTSIAAVPNSSSLTNAALDSTKTTCNTGTPYLAIDFKCTIGAIFAPVIATGNTGPLTSHIYAANDSVPGVVALNSPLDLKLVGTALAVNSTTTTLTSDKNPSTFGESVTFTATVVTGTGTLTGTVSFLDGSTTLAANLLPATQGTTITVTFTTSDLTVGTHSITAIYDNTNDASHTSSTSDVLSQVVNEATATALTSSANPSVLGNSVTFTATVTAPSGGGVAPDGTVTFTDFTTSTTLDTVTLVTTSGVTTATASTSTSALIQGNHTITATYSGNPSTYVNGSSDTLVQDVQAATTTIVTSNVNPSFYGNAVTFTAIVSTTSTATASGTVKFYNGASLIGSSTLVGATNQTTFTTSTLAVGSHTITAVYLGDTNNGPSTSAAITQVVSQATTSTTLTALPDPGIAGKAVVLTATIKVTAGASTPTGTVTFVNTTSSGTVTLGSAALSTAGTATLSRILAPGSHSIVATYSGDTNDVGSASTAYPLTVILATTTTVVVPTPNPGIVLSTITFTATVAGNGGIPSGTVTFYAGGTSIGSATLNAAGVATLDYSGLPAGSYQITASYAGDTNDNPSASAAVTLAVETIPTVTSLGSATTTGTTPQVILVATVIGSTGTPIPTGTVTFYNGTTRIGAATLDSSGVGTMSPDLSSGDYSIIAVYSGDLLHTASTSAALTITSPATDFDISVTPATISMASGSNATFSVTLTSNSGFADTIGLGCSSLPAIVTCHFTNLNSTLAANGTTTVQLTIDTNNPLSGGTTAMNAPSSQQNVFLAGILTPFSVLFGFIFWRLRKRHALISITVLMLSVAALLATGCGGFTQSSAAPGTYVIQVTGVGADSNVSHYQNVTLTITK